MAVFYTSYVRRTKYEDLITTRHKFDQLQSDIRSDVAIIGGGFTGLSAAYNLAQNGVSTILLEGGTIGDGASGRNGGQIGVGHRSWVSELEHLYGKTFTQDIMSLWLDARRHLNDLLCLCDMPAHLQGHISAIHRYSKRREYRDNIDDMARYGYEGLMYLNKSQICDRLGSKRYYGGVYDSNTGHINPLQLVVNLAKVASNAGANLYENSPVIRIEKKPYHFIIETDKVKITADKVLIASNGYSIGKIKSDSLSAEIKKITQHIFPIYSYIAATEPLPLDTDILPNNESVDDSRFAVRYFRKERDNSLIFGGAETYYGTPLCRIREIIHKQIIEVYPQLGKVNLTHGWGGIVAITRKRMPYIQELHPGLVYCGGYSGHGVCLAPYIGKLYADMLINPDEQKQKIKCFKSLKNLPFWGGRYLSVPALFLALNWYALKDKL